MSTNKTVTVPLTLLALLAELVACLRAEAAGDDDQASVELLADIDQALADLRPHLGDTRIDALLAYADVINVTLDPASGAPAGVILSA